MAGNPLDATQAIPVLLAVLLNNPNIKEKAPLSNLESGLFHSILNDSVLCEFSNLDRSNRVCAIEWLKRRHEQVCDDAVRIAEQQIQATGSTTVSADC